MADNTADDQVSKPGTIQFSMNPRPTRRSLRSKENPKVEDSGSKISFSIKSAARVVPETKNQQEEEEVAKPEPKPADRTLTIGKVGTRSIRLKRNIVLPRDATTKTKQELLSEAKEKAEKSGDGNDAEASKSTSANKAGEVGAGDQLVDAGLQEEPSSCVWKARQANSRPGARSPTFNIKDANRPAQSELKDKHQSDISEKMDAPHVDRSKSPQRYRSLRSRSDRYSPRRSPEPGYCRRDSDRRRTRSSFSEDDRFRSGRTVDQHDDGSRKRSYHDDNARSRHEPRNRDRSPSPQYRGRTRGSNMDRSVSPTEDRDKRLRRHALNDEKNDSVFSDRDDIQGRGRRRSIATRRTQQSQSRSPIRGGEAGQKHVKAKTSDAVVVDKGMRLVEYDSPGPSSPVREETAKTPVKSMLKLVDYSPDRATPERLSTPTPEKRKDTPSREKKAYTSMKTKDLSLLDRKDEEMEWESKHQSSSSKSDRSPSVRQTRRSSRRSGAGGQDSGLGENSGEVFGKKANRRESPVEETRKGRNCSEEREDSRDRRRSRDRLFRNRTPPNRGSEDNKDEESGEQVEEGRRIKSRDRRVKTPPRRSSPERKGRESQEKELVGSRVKLGSRQSKTSSHRISPDRKDLEDEEREVPGSNVWSKGRRSKTPPRRSSPGGKDREREGKELGRSRVRSRGGRSKTPPGKSSPEWLDRESDEWELGRGKVRSRDRRSYTPPHRGSPDWKEKESKDKEAEGGRTRSRETRAKSPPWRGSPDRRGRERIKRRSDSEYPGRSSPGIRVQEPSPQKLSSKRIDSPEHRHEETLIHRSSSDDRSSCGRKRSKESPKRKKVISVQGKDAKSCRVSPDSKGMEIKDGGISHYSSSSDKEEVFAGSPDNQRQRWSKEKHSRGQKSSSSKSLEHLPNDKWERKGLQDRRNRESSPEGVERSAGRGARNISPDEIVNRLSPGIKHDRITPEREAHGKRKKKVSPHSQPRSYSPDDRCSSPDDGNEKVGRQKSKQHSPVKRDLGILPDSPSKSVGRVLRDDDEFDSRKKFVTEEKEDHHLSDEDYMSKRKGRHSSRDKKKEKSKKKGEDREKKEDGNVESKTMQKDTSGYGNETFDEVQDPRPPIQKALSLEKRAPSPEVPKVKDMGELYEPGSPTEDDAPTPEIQYHAPDAMEVVAPEDNLRETRTADFKEKSVVHLSEVVLPKEFPVGLSVHGKSGEGRTTDSQLKERSPGKTDSASLAKTKCRDVSSGKELQKEKASDPCLSSRNVQKDDQKDAYKPVTAGKETGKKSNLPSERSISPVICLKKPNPVEVEMKTATFDIMNIDMSAIPLPDSGTKTSSKKTNVVKKNIVEKESQSLVKKDNKEIIVTATLETIKGKEKKMLFDESDEHHPDKDIKHDKIETFDHKSKRRRMENEDLGRDGEGKSLANVMATAPIPKSQGGVSEVFKIQTITPIPTVAKIGSGPTLIAKDKPIISINIPSLAKMNVPDDSQRAHSSIAFTVKGKPSRIGSNLKAFAEDEMVEEVQAPAQSNNLEHQIAKFLAETQIAGNDSDVNSSVAGDKSQKPDRGDRRLQSPGADRGNRWRDRRGRQSSLSPDKRQRRSGSWDRHRRSSGDRQGGEGRDRRPGRGRRSRSRDRWGSGGRSRDRRRSGSPERRRRGSRERQRSHSRERFRAGSRERKRSRSDSRERKRMGSSRDHIRSGSRERRRSGSRERRARSKERAGSKERKQSGSRDRKRSGSQGSRQSGTRERRSMSPERQRSGSRDRQKSGSPPGVRSESIVREILERVVKSPILKGSTTGTIERKSRSREVSVSREQRTSSERSSRRNLRRSLSVGRGSSRSKERQEADCKERIRSNSRGSQGSPLREIDRSFSGGRRRSVSPINQSSGSPVRQRSASPTRRGPVGRGRRRSVSRERRRSTSRSRHRSLQRSISRDRQRSSSRGRRRSNSRERMERFNKRQSPRGFRRSPSVEGRRRNRHISPKRDRRRSVSNERRQSPNRNRRRHRGDSHERRSGSFDRWKRRSPGRGFGRDREQRSRSRERWGKDRSPRFRRSLSREPRRRSLTPRRINEQSIRSASPAHDFPDTYSVDVSEEIFDSVRVNAELDRKEAEMRGEFDVFASMEEQRRRSMDSSDSGHQKRRRPLSGEEGPWDQRHPMNVGEGGRFDERFQGYDDVRFDRHKDDFSRQSEDDQSQYRQYPDKVPDGRRYDEDVHKRRDPFDNRHKRDLEGFNKMLNQHSVGDPFGLGGFDGGRNVVSGPIGVPPNLNISNIPLPGMGPSPMLQSSVPPPGPSLQNIVGPPAPGMPVVPLPSVLPPINQGVPPYHVTGPMQTGLPESEFPAVHPPSASIPVPPHPDDQHLEGQGQQRIQALHQSPRRVPPLLSPDIHVQEVSSTQCESLLVVDSEHIESLSRFPATSRHVPDSSIPEKVDIPIKPTNISDPPQLIRMESDDADIGCATPVQDELSDESPQEPVKGFASHNAIFVPTAMALGLFESSPQKKASSATVNESNLSSLQEAKQSIAMDVTSTEPSEKVKFKFKGVKKIKAMWEDDSQKIRKPLPLPERHELIVPDDMMDIDNDYSLEGTSSAGVESEDQLNSIPIPPGSCSDQICSDAVSSIDVENAEKDISTEQVSEEVNVVPLPIDTVSKIPTPPPVQMPHLENIPPPPPPQNIASMPPNFMGIPGLRPPPFPMMPGLRMGGWPQAPLPPNLQQFMRACQMPPVRKPAPTIDLEVPPPPPPPPPPSTPATDVNRINKPPKKSRWGPEVPVTTKSSEQGVPTDGSKESDKSNERSPDMWVPPEPSEPAPSSSSSSTPSESQADSTSVSTWQQEKREIASLPSVLRNLMQLKQGSGDSRSPDTISEDKSGSISSDDDDDDDMSGDEGTPRDRKHDGSESNDDALTPTRRRSSRIKSIEDKKEKEKEQKERRERIRRQKAEREEKERKEKEDYIRRREAQSKEEEVNFIKPSSPNAGTTSPFIRPGATSPKGDTVLKAEKVKSRWRKYCEIEFGGEILPAPPPSVSQDGSMESPSSTTSENGGGILKEVKASLEDKDSKKVRFDPKAPVALLFNKSESEFSELPQPPSANAERAGSPPLPPSTPPPLPPAVPETNESPPFFKPIMDNIYLSERKFSKEQKEAKRMVCDCTTCKEDRLLGIPPCGDDCLNRMLFIECGNRCPCGDYCTNKRFQRHQYSKVKPFKTDWKGWGLKADVELDEYQFIMEYVGEVLNFKKFKQRCKEYDLDSNKHYYFMALNADEVIDATREGNISRFINHSCDPNCQTQKWTVNGQLRIGFFTKRNIKPGEEITFDYQFERYGKEAQKCYCGAENCRGYIGADKRTPLKILDKVVKDFNQKDVKEKKKKKKEREIFDDLLLDDEIEKMTSQDGMKTKAHVLQLARLMVRSENTDHRVALLKIMQATKEPACLRLFLDYHGLSLMWSWMAGLGSGSKNLKLQILATLKILPVMNKTILQDSKVMNVVQKWAAELAMPESSSGETDTERAGSETPQRSIENTQKVENSDISDVEFAKPGDNIDRIPHKKRKLFQNVKESDENSSDSDCSKLSASASSSITTNQVSVVTDDVSAEMGEISDEKDQTTLASSTENTMVQCDESKTEDISPEMTTKIKSEESPTDSEMETPDESVQSDANKTAEEIKPVLDLEEGEIVEVKKEPTVADIASDLLDTWSSLKDLFKIPKKEQQEERKRTERELDDQDESRGHYRDDYYERDRYRDRERYRDRYQDYDNYRDRDRDRDRHRDRDRYDRKRGRYSESPEREDYRRGGVRDKRRRDDDEHARLAAKKEKLKQKKFNKMDPNLAKLSKKERRDLFEAQVKAQDEADEVQRQQEEYMAQQVERMMEQGLFSYDPNTGQFIPGPGLAEIQFGLDQSQMDPNQMGPGEMPPMPPMGMMGPGGPMGPPMDPSQGPMGPMGPMVPPMDPSQGPMGPRPMGPPPPMGPGGPMGPPPNMDPSMGMMGPGVPMDPSMGPMGPHPMCPSPMGPGPMGMGPMGPPPMDPSQVPMPDVPGPSPSPMDMNQGGPMGPNGPMGPTPFSDPSQMMFPGGGPPGPGPNFPMQPPFMPPQPPFMQQGNQPPPFMPNPNMMGPGGPMMPGQMFNQNQGQMGAPPMNMMGQSVQGFQPNVPTSTPEGDRPSLEQRWQQLQQTTPGLPEPQEEPEEELPPPPPSPPKPKKEKLPPNWKSAKDTDGKTYYYHSITKQTQWDKPSWESGEPETRAYTSPDMAEPPSRSKRHKTTTAAADTSSEDAKRCKEFFRTKMSSYIVHCLNPYRKPDCKNGRISSTEDFKHLARKLTHAVMSKELKYCRHAEDLEVNENVKTKAKDFVRKYMSKFGSSYKKAHSPIHMM